MRRHFNVVCPLGMNVKTFRDWQLNTSTNHFHGKPRSRKGILEGSFRFCRSGAQIVNKRCMLWRFGLFTFSWKHLYKIFECYFVTYRLLIPHNKGFGTWSCICRNIWFVRRNSSSRSNSAICTGENELSFWLSFKTVTFSDAIEWTQLLHPSIQTF